MDELARIVEIPGHELFARIDVELAEVLQHVAVIDFAGRLFHLQDGLELAEAVEAEFLCKTHNRRRRDSARARELMDGDVAHAGTVRDDVLPDHRVRGVEAGLVLVDDFIQLQNDFPLEIPDNQYLPIFPLQFYNINMKFVLRS